MAAVTLRVYDLSQGMARSMSPAILGKQIDGIWHTAIVVFGREYYFGGGICSDPPGASPYGHPQSTQILGHTEKTEQQFLQFLSSISAQFSLSTYHVLENNCNNFSDACAVFLLQKHIPQYILDLPNEAMNSPLGPLIRPIIEQMQTSIRDQSIGHEVDLQPSVAAPASSSRATVASPQSAQYWSTPFTLEKANRAAVVAKLVEYAPDYSDAFSVSQLVTLCLALPPEKCFPALDLLRLQTVGDEASAKTVATQIASILDAFVLAPDAPRPARMMALRVAVNCFKFAASSKVLWDDKVLDSLVDAIATSLAHEHAQVRKTAALLALNLVGAPRRHPEQISKLSEDYTVRLVFSVVERLNGDEKSAPDEARPLLSALIVLVDGDVDTCMLVQTFGLDLSAYSSATLCADSSTNATATALGRMLSSE